MRRQTGLRFERAAPGIPYNVSANDNQTKFSSRCNAKLLGNQCEPRMVTCSKCGTQVVGDAVYCVKCGQRLKPTTPPASHIYCAKCGQPLPHADGSPGTAEAVASVIPLNYAAPLSYLFGWVSGIVVYFMDKRPAVRFHAVQSIIVFGVLTIGGFIFGRMSNRLFLESQQQASSLLAFVAFAVICFTSLALWIILMLKSFEKKTFRVPIAASIAGLIAGNPAA